MDNKLKDLTRKLYDEGLEKGRKEAEELAAKAQHEAKHTVEQAQKRAAEIVEKAKEDAGEISRNSLSELRAAGEQMTAKLKGALREMITAQTVGGAVREAAMNAAFVRELMTKAVEHWVDGEVVAQLPEGTQGIAVKEGEVEFSPAVKSGFRLVAREGGYYVDFTQEAFEAMLRSYLRPKVDEILFGKGNE